MSTKLKKLPKDIQEKMGRYRIELLAFNIIEPLNQNISSCHWYFYKPITELTAFIVNIYGNDSFIEVTYGYASTAFTRMAGDENALVKWGVPDNDITIREKMFISNETDETNAKRKISEMYIAYMHTQKDDLLLLAKEKRKTFINHIHAKLKPLGFKKKANSWTYALTDTYYLMFNAQKSAFSDEYYFNLYIGKNGTSEYGDCYYTRIAPKDMFPTDWQGIKAEEFELFLDESVIPELKKIICTPLTELGQIPSYWIGCYCDRKKCENCWMKKSHGNRCKTLI